MAWHPCRFWQCVENYGGQCFGGGCRLNPMPAPSEPGNTQASDTEDKDNGRHTHETIADIIAEMRRGTRLPGYWRSCDVNEILQYHADRLEAAHRREVDALKQRCAELNAEVAAKDEVIKRLNDAIAEEQRRKMATTEKSLVVGNTAKLREALVRFTEWYKITSIRTACLRTIAETARAALSAPSRNCDKYPTFNDAIRALADKRGWHDGKWNSERYCILAQWLFALATEGENDGNE